MRDKTDQLLYKFRANKLNNREAQELSKVLFKQKEVAYQRGDIYAHTLMMLGLALLAPSLKNKALD